MDEHIYGKFEEAGRPLSASNLGDRDALFEVRDPRIPAKAKPIYDGENKAVIGYCLQNSGWNIYFDLSGQEVGRTEQGLESPLIDPIDFILIFSSIIRLIGKGGIRVGGRVIGGAVGKSLGTKAIPGAFVATMRKVLRSVLRTPLKFTSTTAAHMSTSGRHVPVHILELTIKYGKRMPDSQGIKNAFQYTIEMFKNGKPYKLEVVVRETDWTILHFLYK